MKRRATLKCAASKRRGSNHEAHVIVQLGLVEISMRHEDREVRTAVYEAISRIIPHEAELSHLECLAGTDGLHTAFVAFTQDGSQISMSRSHKEPPYAIASALVDALNQVNVQVNEDHASTH
jgi:hypothetical protein